MFTITVFFLPYSVFDIEKVKDRKNKDLENKDIEKTRIFYLFSHFKCLQGHNLVDFFKGLFKRLVISEKEWQPLFNLGNPQFCHVEKKQTYW